MPSFIRLLLTALAAASLAAQVYIPPILGPSTPAPQAPKPAAPAAFARPGAPGAGTVLVTAQYQEADGPWQLLRGAAEIETSELLCRAEQIDYNQQSGLVEARGRVYFKNYKTGEELHADRIDYNLNDDNGSFYNVTGSLPAKVSYRPGVLFTPNPFLFRGPWAERQAGRYILYDGVLSNCNSLDSWWQLTGQRFDIIPGQRAIVRRGLLRLHKVPVLYAPVFYKSLKESDRKSGFLTPMVGSSSRRGFMLGAGYFWAINRNYDLQYRSQWFTQRGFAHTFDFRGRPTEKSDFNLYVYGVNDRGRPMPDGSVGPKEGGYLLSFTGHADLRHGFYARAVVNHLSSFLFRQAFTESFNEAVFSEVNSTAFIAKDWSSYQFVAAYSGQQNFLSTALGDEINIRSLPRVEFNSRPRALSQRLPIYAGWHSSLGLVRRNQPAFQTRKSVQRLDAEPYVSTVLRWKEIAIVPEASLRATYYGSSFRGGAVAGEDVLRGSGQISTEIVLPSFSRVYSAPRWLGREAKHVVESRVNYRLVNGVSDFRQIIRFDESDIVANTSETSYTLTNRWLVKRRDGRVLDALVLDLNWRQFLRPDFGGAVVNGQRNTLGSSAGMTGYAFLDGARRYSPVVASLAVTPRPGLTSDLRADYDPLRGHFTNMSLALNGRLSNYFGSVGYNRVACIPLYGPNSRFGIAGDDPCILERPHAGSVLTPVASQYRGLVGFGQEGKRGWNGGFLAIYDTRVGIMQYANTQVTYNTECCAYSFQFRRFNVGSRNENQYRIAITIANIGSFGTLRRQERLF